MKIAVLGSGTVGRALAGKLAELGHQVTIGTRDVAATLARTEPDGMGGPPFRDWHAANPHIDLAAYAEAAADADLVVNATHGAGSIEALEAAGRDDLAGVLVMDVANPLDFSAGMPPSLFVCNTDSLGEQIQRAFPETKVVKTLNTLNASLMVDPKSLGESSSIFVSGNDSQAKATVVSLLQSFGHDDVIDLGPLETARGTEMLLPIWLRLMGTLGTGTFNFKIVR